MAQITPVQLPITGGESIDNSADPLFAISQFCRAFNTRDLELMLENWDTTPPETSLDNPLGGIRRGWENIYHVYERIFASPAVVQAEFRDYTLHTRPQLFLAVGRERGHFTSCYATIDLSIRTTRIFRLHSNRWR